MSAATAPAAGFRRDPPLGGLVLVLIGGVLLIGPLAALADTLALAAVAAVAIGASIATRPVLGAYLYLALTPLIVGISRGAVMPFVRPNEALLLLVLSAFGAHLLAAAMAGRPRPPAVGRVGLAILLMAVAASVLPLALRAGRGAPVAPDDILYALVLWKYLAIFWFFREAVTTPAQVAICLKIILGASLVVAVIAILQVAGLFGIAELLWIYYDHPFGGSTEIVTGRATATLASSFGVADTMTMSLVIALAWRTIAPPRQQHALALAAGIFLLAAIAAGQFSGFLGLAIAVIALGQVTGHLGRILRLLVPFSAVALIAVWPLIEQRLAGFAGPGGMPASWLGRIDNLERFVWPELSSGLNWLTGVRPAARLPAPEPWRDFVYIESGYAWLLWTGGIALLLAFVWFVYVALRDLIVVLRAEQGPVVVAAAGAFAGLVMIASLMLFDPHLTMRGGADLFFPVLALALAGLTLSRDRPTSDGRARPDDPR